MSYQAFENLNTTPTITCGVFANTATQNTNITFKIPFSAGQIPIVSVQNTQAATWENIVFTVSQVTNTGFTVTQYDTTGAGNLEIVSCSYIAVYVPNA